MSDDYDPDEVRWACLNGQCGPFAALLAARTGWKLGSIEGTLNGAEGGIHAVVFHPAGGVVDAAGWHADADEYAAVYAASQGFEGTDFEVIEFTDDTEVGYGPGFEGADFPPAALVALVFQVLDDLGYDHAAPEKLVHKLPSIGEIMLGEYLDRHREMADG